MAGQSHDPIQHVTQMRQVLSADKLSIGFFLGAGCPCSVRVPDTATRGERPLIADIRGLTNAVDKIMSASAQHAESYAKLMKSFKDDGDNTPTVEGMLNRIRALRDVAGKACVRDMSFAELNNLDTEICTKIREIVRCDLPAEPTAYHALARFIRNHRQPYSEIFTTNYDLLMEQALEGCRVPYFDGFVGAARPFFHVRAIEENGIPGRWSRLWKLHGSINWRFNKNTKDVVRSDHAHDGDELLIHPSHMKYEESRRMPYFVMIDRLRAFLRQNDQPVALFVLGYSFGDQHINEAIVENLKSNDRSACFALQFGDLAPYQDAVRLAKENPNLSVLASDKAVIRRIEAKWVASAAADVGGPRRRDRPDHGIQGKCTRSMATGRSHARQSERGQPRPLQHPQALV